MRLFHQQSVHAVSSARGETVIGSIEYRIVHIYVSVNWTVKFSSSSAHNSLSLLEGGLF